MNQTKIKLASAFSMLLILLGMATVPGLAVQTASGAASCPSVTRVVGSTTVGPIAAGEEAQFESNFGTDMQVTQNGSGAGIAAINATPPQAELGMSSRPLTFGSPGTESANLYTYVIARDGLIIEVKSDAQMNFISDITVTNLRDIYSGTITTWNQINGAYPNRSIVPRARITTSGSYSDFLRLTGTTAANEATTINNTGLPRLNESVDMADAAAHNVDQIAYTSLANVSYPGTKVLSVNGIAGTEANVANSSYPLLRSLHMMTLDKTHADRIDNSPTVFGDDVINFTFTPLGQNLIANEGFVPETPAATQPIPDFDINMDGNTNIGDLGAITAKWGLTSTCKGWIRADANNNNTISLGDIGIVTSHWGQTGFVPPDYHGE
jgi:phosphate transport system substrate-binding protein